MADRLVLNGRVLDIGRAELCDAKGCILPLRPQALSVLIELARRPGEVVSRREIMALVWPGVVVTDDSLVQCVVEIRRALGDVDQRVVRTVPRRGYRLTPDAPSTPDTLAVGQDGRSARRRMTALVGGVVTLAALAVVLILPAGDVARRNHGGSADGATVAVLPFRAINPAPGAAAPDGEGFAWLVAGELARNSELRIVSMLSAAELRVRSQSVRDIGAITGAGYVVDGSIGRDGERLALKVQVVDTGSERVAWSGRFESTAEELPRVTEVLVERISASVGSTVRELRMSAQLGRAPASLDAHALTLHGIALAHQRMNPEALREARRELERATRLDPNYAPAWTYLGVVKTVLIFSRNDPELTLQDHPGAVADIRRAIALDPSAAVSWRQLSFVIDSTHFPEEALAAAQRAVELGPGDPDNWLALGLAQYHARRIDDAMRNVDKAIAWNGGLRPAVYAVAEARVRYAKGDYDRALRSAGECIERVPALAVCKAIWLSSHIRMGRAADAEAAWPDLVAATPWLRSYRYAPAETSEARAIDADLERLRGTQ
jgi:DNA-binding winged helix-turn-helix (wHTH) protein/TolB-like protein/tetratricopeptide (TPR) repeat protein